MPFATRDETRAGRVGREARSEARNGFRTKSAQALRAPGLNKIACATLEENRKSGQDAGVLRVSYFSEFLAWERTRLNGLAADACDGVRGISVRKQRRGTVSGSSHEDSETISAAIERPSDHNA
jgi:hypothetical protein